MAAAAEPWTELLILQASPFCNIDCRYCYLPDRSNTRRMSQATLEAVFSQLLPSRFVRERLSVIWHAGEPLAVPVSWYETAFAIADAYCPPGVQLEHAFQTNATLVNAGWVAFLRRTSARVSVSIDGPDWLHDSSRRTRRGGGTFDSAMRGVRLLQEAGLSPSTITVLTRESLDHPDALFDFFRDAGLSDVALNVEELEGANEATTMCGHEAEAAYRRFMRRFIERMLAEPGTLRLREWSNAQDVLRYGVAEGTNQEAEPLRILSVAHDGRVSSFSPELLGLRDERYADFVFGAIGVEDLEVIATRIVRSRLRADIAAGMANCRRTCGWFRWCGGGSPSNKFFEAGDVRVTETAFCRLTRQALLDTAITIAERETVLL